MTEVTPWAAVNDLVPFQLQEVAWKYGVFIGKMHLSWDKCEFTIIVYDGRGTFEVHVPANDPEQALEIFEVTLKFRC